MKTKQEVIDGVKTCTSWWIEQRRKKLEDQLTETMSVNPFLMPFLFDYHNLENFEHLADLIIASHLMTGHNTGFGKLIDEKVLPRVFDAQKLDAKFRITTPPFNEACFDEIDHLVKRPDGNLELLSLKAGKWTIQLTMAVQLNRAFSEILEKHPDLATDISVGVFYGKKDGLTDKYDLITGVNRGANHDLFDLRERVHVYAGRDFWKWLNEGDDHTQEWVLEGILEALAEEKINESATALLEKFKSGVVEKYDSEIRNDDGEVDWKKLLTMING